MSNTTATFYNYPGSRCAFQTRPEPSSRARHHHLQRRSTQYSALHSRKAGAHPASCVLNQYVTPPRHMNNVMQHKALPTVRHASSSSLTRAIYSRDYHVKYSTAAASGRAYTNRHVNAASSNIDMKFLLTRNGLKPLHHTCSSSFSSRAVWPSASSSSSLSKDDDGILHFVHHQFCIFPCKHPTQSAAVDLLLHNLADHPDSKDHVARAAQGKQPPNLDTETVSNIRNMQMVQEPSSFDYDADSDRSSDDESSGVNADSEGSSDEESLLSINGLDHIMNQGHEEKEEEGEHHVGLLHMHVEPAAIRHTAEDQEEEGSSSFKFQFHELYSPSFEERRKAYGPAYPPHAFVPYSLF